MKFREYRILRISFWTKLAFIFIELALVIAFGVMNYQDRYNTAAVLEWTVCLVSDLQFDQFPSRTCTAEADM